MGTFVLAARGPFSLAASSRFLEGFTPAAFTGTAGQPLEMAFPVKGTWQTAGVRVREHPGGAEYEVVSPSAPGRELLTAVRAQVARILSLDVDGSGFPAVGERDPVIAGLQRRYPGLRPVGFWSPYEAAAACTQSEMSAFWQLPMRLHSSPPLASTIARSRSNELGGAGNVPERRPGLPSSRRT